MNYRNNSQGVGSFGDWTRFGQLSLLVAVLAALLFGGAARSGAESGAPDAQTVERPTDRASALEFIRLARAAEAAERRAALEDELTPLEREWGVKIRSLQLTAAGYTLDFRYEVLDAGKAAPLLDRSYNFTPFVIVEKSGARLGVPFTEKAGSLRSSVSVASQIKPGRVYSALFANPGHHVSPGDKVTVVIGDFKAENVTVR